MILFKFSTRQVILIFHHEVWKCWIGYNIKFLLKKFFFVYFLLHLLVTLFLLKLDFIKATFSRNCIVAIAPAACWSVNVLRRELMVMYLVRCSVTVRSPLSMPVAVMSRVFCSLIKFEMNLQTLGLCLGVETFEFVVCSIFENSM